MKTILIIDDDEFSQALYGDVLEKTGFRVIYASDGKVGLEAAMTEKPDAIVLDIVMPVMDGFAVLQALKRDSALHAIPVIVLSGAGSEEDMKRSKELGAEICISKLATLPAKLAECLTEMLIKGLPLKIETLVTKVGELSNTIFVEASDKIQAVLAEMLRHPVTIGYFKATVVSTEILKEHLDALTEQTGLVASYSVLKPPMGAAMLIISKETALALVSFLKGSSLPLSASSSSAGLTELYNIVSNTFLNVITAGLKADTIILFHPPMLSTPNIAVRLMRKDGFVFKPEGLNFIFRQTYYIAETNIEFEFVLLFSSQGLELLKKWHRK